jgi:hypothetical protein
MNIIGYSILLDLSVLGFGVFTHRMLTTGKPEFAMLGLFLGSAVSISISLAAVAAGRMETTALRRKWACALHVCAALALFDSILSPAYPGLFKTINIVVGIGLTVCGILLLLVPQDSEPNQSADPELSPDTPSAEQASCHA